MHLSSSRGLSMVQRAPVSMLLTVDEFLRRPLPDGKAELVRGELRMTPPPGGRHGVIAGNLLLLLANHVKDNKLGRAFPDSVGYELIALPRTVRSPDVSFVQAARLPEEGIGPGLLELAPDLAVEILSPSETASRLEEKLEDYRISGVPLAWVIDSEWRTVMIVSADAPIRWLRNDDVLDGAHVVAGFTCRVADLFEGMAK
jgi:Uma2 family endonuclease